MSAAIHAHGGTIDKFIGDCVMAFWNAPLDDKDHARHAFAAALDMRERLATLNRELALEPARANLPPLRMGIGINTGTCCVGNMGSEQRFDYSVLGDAVNLASRLESQTKSYPVDVIVGEASQADAPEFAALEIDRIRVKGKTEPSRMFALLGDARLAADPGFQALAREHGAMLQALAAERWDEARALAQACRASPALASLGIGDLYAIYEARCEAHEIDPATAREGTLRLAKG
jgi:adenylate cyclase